MTVPFLFSTQGYGLFLNTSCPQSGNCTLDVSLLRFRGADNATDYFIIHARRPPKSFAANCELNGFSHYPPFWSPLWRGRQGAARELQTGVVGRIR